MALMERIVCEATDARADALAGHADKRFRVLLRCWGARIVLICVCVCVCCVRMRRLRWPQRALVRISGHVKHMRLAVGDLLPRGPLVPMLYIWKI